MLKHCRDGKTTGMKATAVIIGRFMPRNNAHLASSSRISDSVQVML